MARLLSVSIPDELMQRIERLAAATGRTKSALVREALAEYEGVQELRALQEYGRERAERLGIGPEDIEDVIDEFRAEQRENAP